MARQFTWKEVTELVEGEGCFLCAPASEVRRKVGLYGARNNKHFQIDLPDSMRLAGQVRVIRLPVTDAELPGAA